MATIESHLRELAACRRCPAMYRPPVVGRPVKSRILLVGQAPGDKEPVLGRPFAWTAGKTLFKWLESATGWDEDTARSRIYFAAVCRCFPGKNPKGGDRVPNETEIAACSDWMAREFALLRPTLVLPVGKLAISQFLEFTSLADVVGRPWTISRQHGLADLIPLPHPSGASTWHRMEPGRTLLEKALELLAQHPAVRGAGVA
jgi:uracil-DNA glycosylase